MRAKLLLSSSQSGGGDDDPVSRKGQKKETEGRYQPRHGTNRSVGLQGAEGRGEAGRPASSWRLGAPRRPQLALHSEPGPEAREQAAAVLVCETIQGDRASWDGSWYLPGLGD